MNEDVIACGYKISFKENGFEMAEADYREIRTVDIAYIVSTALFVVYFNIIPFLALCFSILCFIKGGYPLAIIFALCFLFAVYLKLLRGVHIKKAKCFRYVVDENGITNVQVNGTYHINWNEVAYYGFVDNIPNGVRDNKEQRASCLIVSMEFNEKKKLRKRINRPSVNRYGHINSNDFICVDFLQLEMSEELKSRMLAYFHRYMGEDVESYD